MRSFDDLVDETDRFFSIPTTNGFKLSHSLPIRNKYRLQSSVYLAPLELRFVADKFEPVPECRRSVDFTLSIPLPLGDLSVTVGSDLAASISRRLTPSLSAFANAQRRSGATADFGLGLSASTAVANLAVEFRRSALHHSVSFGFDDISVGFSRRRPHSTSVLMRVPVGGWRVQLIAEMQKQEATLAAWNGTAGGRVRLRPGEWPVAEAAQNQRMGDSLERRH
jgi:hypothetical protein